MHKSAFFASLPTEVEISKLLNKYGLRATKLRVKIVKLFVNRREPYSAKALHAKLGSDLTSAYRNIWRLQEVGLVNMAPHSRGAGLFFWADGRERLFSIRDKTTDTVEHTDPEIAEIVTQILEGTELRLRERGFSGVVGFATFRANFPKVSLPPHSHCSPHPYEPREACGIIDDPTGTASGAEVQFEGPQSGH